MATFISNLGNSDLNLEALRGLLVPAGFSEDTHQWRLREVYGWCREHYSQAEQVLDFPIIRKFLERATSLDCIVLVATDQGASPKNQKDTLALGQVLQRYLQAGYTDAEGVLRCFPNVQVKVYRDNPSDFDRADRWYANFLTNDDSIAKSSGLVFGGLTTGTPAMNAMLLIHGMRILGSRFHTLYVPHDVANGVSLPARHLSIAADLVKQAQLENVISSLRHCWNRRDFAGLQTLLMDNQGLLAGADQDYYQDLLQVAQYLTARLMFDFEAANESLRTASINNQGLQYYFSSQISSVRQLLEAAGKSPAERDPVSSRLLLQELYTNLWWKFEREEWTDLLARVFRLQEGVLQHLAAKQGMRLVEKQGELYINRMWLDEQPDLDSQLQAKGIRLDWPASRRSLAAVLELLGADKQLLTDIQRVNQLAELRNKSLTGHGYQGVSRQRLQEAIGDKPVDSIVAWAKGLIQSIGGSAEPHYLALELHVKRLWDRLLTAKKST